MHFLFYISAPLPLCTVHCFRVVMSGVTQSIQLLLLLFLSLLSRKIYRHLYIFTWTITVAPSFVTPPFCTYILKGHFHYLFVSMVFLCSCFFLTFMFLKKRFIVWHFICNSFPLWDVSLTKLHCALVTAVYIYKYMCVCKYVYIQSSLYK